MQGTVKAIIASGNGPGLLQNGSAKEREREKFHLHPIATTIASSPPVETSSVELISEPCEGSPILFSVSIALSPYFVLPVLTGTNPRAAISKRAISSSRSPVSPPVSKYSHRGSLRCR